MLKLTTYGLLKKLKFSLTIHRVANLSRYAKLPAVDRDMNQEYMTFADATRMDTTAETTTSTSPHPRLRLCIQLRRGLRLRIFFYETIRGRNAWVGPCSYCWHWLSFFCFEFVFTDQSHIGRPVLVWVCFCASACHRESSLSRSRREKIGEL